MPQLKARIGMRVDASGFGLYECTGANGKQSIYAVQLLTIRKAGTVHNMEQRYIRC